MRFFEITDHKLIIADVDKYWILNKIWSWLTFRKYKRFFGYALVATVNNNQKLRIGDRFIAGDYYPPIIFEIIKKLGKKTIVVESKVASTKQDPSFIGKCIVVTK